VRASGPADLGPTDLLTLDEVAQRLRLSPKTIKRLRRDAGLPLFRILPNGALFGCWPEIARWVLKRRSLQN
jgi:hypothetical protein